MSYLDQILDQFGEEGDKVIYGLHLQNNLEEFCGISLDEYEEIYFSLFDDDVQELSDYNVEDIDDYHDRMEIFYTELIIECRERYSYVRFLAEISRKQWADIIEKNMEVQKIKVDVRIFNYYNNLKNGHIITWKIPS